MTSIFSRSSKMFLKLFLTMLNVLLAKSGAPDFRIYNVPTATGGPIQI